MTVKLYENNSLLKECCAVVTACAAAEGKYLVELDQTVFFPEGGGQLSDRGTIGAAKVVHVSEKEGHILHECDRALTEGLKVEAKIDWSVRLDRMQQHLGEHLLSYAFWKLFKANNVGFHMNEDNVTIDLDREMTAEELLQAEHLTNEIIWDNRPVTVSYMDSTEVAAHKNEMRKFNDKLTGLLRIVAVDGADICTCCGTHPPFTGMIGSVKIIRSDKHKNGCRVEFLCGRRALLDADRKNSILLGVAADFSAKPEQVPERLAKLHKEQAELVEKLKEKTLALLERELADRLVEAKTSADGTRILVMAIEDGDGKESKESKALLPKLTNLENTLSLIVSVQKERISYMLALGTATKADCRSNIKLVNEAFGGRGGGTTECAQGGAPYCNDWQEKLEQAKKSLLAL